MTGEAPRHQVTHAAWLAPLRGLGRIVLSILLILWTLLDLLLFPLLRPLLAWLARLRLFDWIGTLLGQLPPYAALLVFAIPFVIIEPIKAFALYWLATGHVVTGAGLYGLAYVASIVIVERIYHAAHAPLMRIDWFRRLMSWLDGIRRIGLDWARSTPLWRSSAAAAIALRRTIAGWIASLR